MTNFLTFLAIILSTAASLFLLNSFIKSKLKTKLSANENPISISYFKGILFLGLGLLQSELIHTFQTLIKILPSQLAGNSLVLKEISFYCAFFGITLLVFVVLFWLSSLLFSLFNKGESIFVEVANDNLNSVILFSGIMLAFVFAVKTGLTPLLDEFIPYPEMPLYR
ncbi:hypothetical protein [Allomuricauda sp. ARW1Y1]|jgi:hypothetical protein|uniref:hypothetical protein n=1 Tax=Allomuricauda sp. ARW1Y1 TaxID=2663843 RepID=UPI0015C8B598|nr:hypothetical protein [Muricauda sp. ARW1Y1]NYJ28601.1 hypothetical protein [Muricauda sp. ARW1Y1]